MGSLIGRLALPRRKLRFAATGLLALIVIGLPFAAGTVLRGAALKASAAAGLALDRIEIDGRVHAKTAALLDALKVTRGMPILAVPLDEACKRIAALPWVARVSVERHLPDTLVVRLDERRPLALWQHDGAMVLIDETGAPIAGEAPGRWRDLPQLVGAGVPAHAKALVDALAAEADLAKRVPTAIWVEDRRWNLVFDNGIVAEMPEQGFAEAWARLAQIERNHDLLDRDIAAIDLRLDGVTTVQRNAAPAPAAPTKTAKAGGTRG